MMVRLGDIAEFINGGAWSDKEYTLDGIPVVKVTNLKNGSVDLNEVNFIPESSLDKYGRHLLRKGDLVIATVGSHPNLVASAAGRATIIPAYAEGTLLNQNALCIRTNSNDLHQGYLGYLGKSDLFQGYVKSVGRGAANQVRIALGLIKEFSFELPPLHSQHKIASILSAYDDLIENNLNRIKLLEEKALMEFKILYNTNKLIEFPIEDVWEIKYGKNLPQSKITEVGKYPVYGAAGRIGFYEEFNYEFPVALVTSRGNGSGVAHRTNMSAFVTNNSFAFVPKEDFVNVHFHLSEMILRDLELTQLRSGTAQPQLTIAGLIGVNLNLPKTETLIEFNKIIDPVFELIFILEKQNTKLREARDILLPRLMNGEIEV